MKFLIFPSTLLVEPESVSTVRYARLSPVKVLTETEWIELKVAELPVVSQTGVNRTQKQRFGYI